MVVAEKNLSARPRIVRQEISTAVRLIGSPMFVPPLCSPSQNCNVALRIRFEAECRPNAIG